MTVILKTEILIVRE